MRVLNARNVNNAACRIVVVCGNLTVTGHFTHCHILAGRVLSCNTSYLVTSSPHKRPVIGKNTDKAKNIFFH